MLLQCPSCRRTGNLPNDLASAAHRVRCRKCNARFSTAPGQLQEVSPPARVPLRPSAAAQPVPAGVGLAQVSSEGFFSGFDDYSSPSALGPGDSQYEVSVAFED